MRLQMLESWQKKQVLQELRGSSSIQGGNGQMTFCVRTLLKTVSWFLSVTGNVNRFTPLIKPCMWVSSTFDFCLIASIYRLSFASIIYGGRRPGRLSSIARLAFCCALMGAQPRARSPQTPPIALSLMQNSATVRCNRNPRGIYIFTQRVVSCQMKLLRLIQ